MGYAELCFDKRHERAQTAPLTAARSIGVLILKREWEIGARTYDEVL